MISIIIPTWNEERLIGPALDALRAEASSAEIVVVDGGSQDATQPIIRSRGVRLIVQDRDGPRGRAAAYNQAAAAAQGEVLLFLHVDTRLPPGGIRLVEAALADPAVAGGGFLPTFGDAGEGFVGTLLRLNERVWRWRTRRFRWFAGDLAPFIRREWFEAIGGYPMIHLAEDWAFASRLRSLPKLAVIEEPVLVSARRFVANGVLRTLLVTASVEAMYRAGVGTPFLAWWYRRWLPRERG